MFKFIINYFKKRKEYFEECNRLSKIRDKISGLERLVKYHKKVLHLTNGERFCVAHIVLDVIDTLEEHEERIKKIEIEK